MHSQKDNKKKILISGWYGYGNIGDELILESIISLYKNNDASNISVLSFNPEYTNKNNGVISHCQVPFSFIWLIKSILNFQLFKTLKAFYQCDVFLLGGGGFLSDWQPEVPRKWLRQLRLAKLFGKETIVFRIGAGPFTTEKGKNTTKKYLDSYADEITVRDNESFRQLTEIVGLEKIVKIKIDPVAEMNFAQSKIITKTYDVGIVLTEFFKSKYFSDKQRNSSADLIKNFENQIDIALQLQKKVSLIFFQPEFERSLKNHFQSRYNGKVSLYDCSDFKEAIRVFQLCEKIISFRLHGNILAYALKIPFLPIIYHHKGRGFLEQINFHGPKIDLLEGRNTFDPKPLDPEHWIAQTLEFFKQ